MRRAVSTAYYALFHALARMCADELVGGSHWRTEEWSRVYRALDHRTAKTVLSGAGAASLSPFARSVGASFSELQERRHEADYDPAFFSFYFDETDALIELAANAVGNLGKLTTEQRRALAVMLVIRTRQKNLP